MPTGYTSPLYDAEMSFEDFVIHVASNITQGSFSGKLSKVSLDLGGTKAKLEEAKANLTRIQNMTEEELEQAALEEFEETRARQREHEKSVAALKTRYESMLEQVKTWQPPTPDHQGLKDLMLEQLQTSLEFDTSCVVQDRQERPKTAKQYRQEQIQSIQDHIASLVRSMEKQRKRVRTHNEWVEALANDLGVLVDE